MSTSNDHPEGFEVPLHLALTQPVLFAGVPREFGILTLVIALIFSLGLGLWWLGIPVGLVLHASAVALTRHDPLWLAVLRRHLRQPSYWDA